MPKDRKFARITEYGLFLKLHNTLDNKMKTQVKRKRIILWTVIVVIAILVIMVAINWGSFAEGFEAGGRLAE